MARPDDHRRPELGLSLSVLAVTTVVLLPHPATGLVALILLGIARWSASGGDAESSAVSLAALCWATVGAASVASFGLVWPIPQALGLLVAFATWTAFGRDQPDWLRAGTVDRTTFWLAAASVPLTSTALAWFITSGRTDLDTAAEGLVGLPAWAIPLAGIGFSLANPTVEEILFRGALQTALTRTLGNVGLSVVLQGIAFGAIHFNGVPGGPLGMAMAGLWGTVLGIVRHRTGSIRIPWLVHVFANATMFTVIATMAINDGIL
ncbi:MAG: CPBP family intramembrane glutamic endopeptidase [Microthrixaceae bacterium]